MKTLAIIDDLKKHKYVCSFLVPCLIVGCIGGIIFFAQSYLREVPRPDAISEALNEGFWAALFLGIPFGFLCLFSYALSQKLRWIRGAKSSILLTSIVVCITVFALGFFNELIPDTRHHKFMMPGTYQVYLRKEKYTVWYYPDWERADQKRFPLMELTSRLRKSEFPKPLISIRKKDGLEVQYQVHPSRIGGGGSRIYKKRIGGFQIKEPGTYVIQSSLEDEKKNYVLAIVPYSAYDPNARYEPRVYYFAGDEDTTDLLTN